MRTTSIINSRRRASAGIAIAALVAIAAGCGSDDEVDPSGDPATSAAATSIADPTGSADADPSQSDDADDDADETDADDGDAGEACEFVSTDAVSEAVGQPMALQAGSASACIFEAESDDGPGIQIFVTDIQIDPDEYAEGTKEICKEPITDIDAGDQAWTCDTIGPQGTVFEGSQVATVDAKDFESDDEAFAALGKILPEITL